MAIPSGPVLTRTGEAGRSGERVRSDLRVIVELETSGGLELELVSRVALYYGEAIRSQSLANLRELGVEHARVRVEDSGALPFTISARIEAAARRAGLSPLRRVLPPRVALRPQSPKGRIRRARLYLPGNEPKYFINAALTDPDAVIFDLEDSVHYAEKDCARILVRNALRAVDLGNTERMVRINQFPLGITDLDEVIPGAPDVVLIPKVESDRQVIEVDRRIGEILEQAGLVRSVWLMPIVESAIGVENAFSIATSSDRICALTIGLEDYTSDLGVVKTAGGHESLYARMRIVNAAKAAGVQAIDSVYSDIDDLQGLAQWGQHSRSLGFEGMGCVHPSQVPVVKSAFMPSMAEIDKALRIVAAFEQAKQQGLGVVSLGSKMIDAPVVNRALKLVQLARAMGCLSNATSNQEEKQ